ncbi:MAG: ATP-binding protein [Candidatus Omnitrophica bacterium]|nr:ATP-binding protein [Candidatus Omnitrophota bacterium]
MRMDVRGRVRNVQLPVSKPLLPVFEAIMNSIQAIDDAKESKGRIEIEVIRDCNSTMLVEDKPISDITGFVIRDNGIGFDEKNYEAFLTSDTTYKVLRGGKGIGRFLWLAAFEKVEVESVFITDEKINKRCFKFCMSELGIENHSCIEQSALNRGTVIRLSGYKDKYSQHCRKKLDSLATLIVEQFLDIFISAYCPKIIIHDNLIGESLDLDIFYEKEMVANTESKEILIKDEKFNLIFVRLYSTHISDHKINFCANDRVVLSEKIVGIPNLLKRLSDSDGKEFVFTVYVNSTILDLAVNQERTNFNLLKDDETIFEKNISLSEIRQTVRDACKDYLKPYTAPVAKRKKERIEEFVSNDGVMYRPIIKHLGSKIDEIEPNADDAEIDRRLYEGYYELQTSLKSEGQKLLQDVKNITEDKLEEYLNRFNNYFEKVTEANSANLARYVCHRKAIIEFLKNQLGFQKDGSYSRESQVHSIIFPLGKTSNEIDFNEHNLWLIDERLAFHTYLSSDQPIKKAELLENTSKKEPDLLIFDKAIALSESSTVPFNSITIIEFKRPLRNEYSANENPVEQILNYMRDIKSGKALNHKGRPITISENLPFYCYIVCDITPKLKEWVTNFNFIETPDGLGYFMQHSKFNAYFEVISYEKLVSDAEKRNKAFFHNIGL